MHPANEQWRLIAEPSTIAKLRTELAQYDAIEEPENCGCSPWPASGNVVDAARAVVDEWDRGVAAHQEAMKAALRDSEKLIALPYNEECPMASKCRIGQPCEHYPPDHPLHVHADCCK